jgi:hypothetical protein
MGTKGLSSPCDGGRFVPASCSARLLFAQFDLAFPEACGFHLECHRVIRDQPLGLHPNMR